VRHFLTLLDLSTVELKTLLKRAIELKGCLRKGDRPPLFLHQVMGMIFEKSSTRTRISFETAMSQAGGSAIFLSSRDTQFGRGEPLEDSARVMSSMIDIVMIRTFGQDKLVQFARAARVPVINALTDQYHPCQLLADMQTYLELRGNIAGKQVAWIGDGNNMCHSYINAAIRFEFELLIACPEGFEPEPHILANAEGRARIVRTSAEAAKGAHLVVTDVWASMGQEDQQTQRVQAFKEFQVTRELLDLADPSVLFMHCLPAHRGEEISHDLLEDPRSVVWEEAGNRLHAQKALIEFLLRASNNSTVR